MNFDKKKKPITYKHSKSSSKHRGHKPPESPPRKRKYRVEYSSDGFSGSSSEEESSDEEDGRSAISSEESDLRERKRKRTHERKSRGSFVWKKYPWLKGIVEESGINSTESTKEFHLLLAEINSLQDEHRSTLCTSRILKDKIANIRAERRRNGTLPPISRSQAPSGPSLALPTASTSTHAPGVAMHPPPNIGQLGKVTSSNLPVTTPLEDVMYSLTKLHEKCDQLYDELRLQREMGEKWQIQVEELQARIAFNMDFRPIAPTALAASTAPTAPLASQFPAPPSQINLEQNTPELLPDVQISPYTTTNIRPSPTPQDINPVSEDAISTLHHVPPTSQDPLSQISNENNRDTPTPSQRSPPAPQPSDVGRASPTPQNSHIDDALTHPPDSEDARPLSSEKPPYEPTEESTAHSCSPRYSPTPHLSEGRDPEANDQTTEDTSIAKNQAVARNAAHAREVRQAKLYKKKAAAQKAVDARIAKTNSKTEVDVNVDMAQNAFPQVIQPGFASFMSIDTRTEICDDSEEYMEILKMTQIPTDPLSRYDDSDSDRL